MSDPTSQSIASRLAQRKGLWISAGVVLVVDQVSKLLAQLTLRPDGWQAGDPQPHYAFIDGLVHGTWAHGELGFKMDGPVGLQVASLVIAVVFWSAVFYGIALRSGPKRWLLRVAGGMLLGGAVSNIAEGAITGHIRNFMVLGFDSPLWRDGLDVPIHGGMYAQHPSFSLAAVALTLGLILLLIGALVGKPKQEKPAPPPPPQPGKRPPPGRAEPRGSKPPSPHRSGSGDAGTRVQGNL